jgi:hypothetical protein
VVTGHLVLLRSPITNGRTNRTALSKPVVPRDLEKVINKMAGEFSALDISKAIIPKIGGLLSMFACTFTIRDIIVTT